MTTLGVIGLINAISSLALAVLVWRKSPIPRLAWSYALVNLTIGLFSISYCIWQCSDNPSSGFFWLKMLTFWGMWINQSFLIFVWCFLGFPRWQLVVLVALGLIRVVFSVLNISDQFFTAVEPRAGWGYWPYRLPALEAYVAFWHAELLYAFTVMFRAFRRSVGREREQLKYMLLAFAIGYIGGATNWPLWFGIPFPPHFIILITAYVSIMAYAIVKHRMMDIRVVFQRTLVYSLLTAILTSIYFGTMILLIRLFEGRLVEATAWSSATAAGVIAMAFHPLRLGIQRWINRRFPREALDQEILREATSGFVHEIKRPLVNISLPAQLALREIQDARDGKIAPEEAWDRLTERMHYIVRESMDAGEKMEALRELVSAGPPVFKFIDLSEVARKAVAAEARRAEKAGVAVLLVAENPIQVRGNAKQLEIAIANVLKNGVEAAADQSGERKVAVEVKLAGAEVIMTIRDTGAGISKVNAPQVFKSYFSTKGPDGMGIGLSLVREIIRMHSGTIVLDSIPGQGTTFTISLPAGDVGPRV